MENANASNATAAPNDEELRRLNRAYRALSLCNGEIARATSEQQLRNALCETLVNVGGYPLAWIGFAEPESFRVKPVALAGDAAAQPYLDSIHVTWADDEHGRGPTGTAFRSRQPAINRDSSNNPEYGPWRDQALRFGLRSSIALPLLFQNKLLGALTVYATAPDAFDADEVQLLMHVAENLAFALTALRASAAMTTLAHQLQLATDVRARFAILDDAPNAFMALDREWRYLFINLVGARLVSRTPEALLGKVVWEVFPEAIGTRFKGAFERAMHAREIVALEEYFEPLDRWFDVQVYPIETGIAVYFSDITTRKRLSLSLRESEERFRQVTEAIDDVFWLSDAISHRVYYVNPAYERIWGRARQDLYAHADAWLDAVHPDDRARLVQSLPQQARGGWDETYRVVKPDGTLRVVRDRAYPVRDAEGSVHRIAGLARDITEYRRLEEQLRHAQKMEAIGRLAGGVAHDFNNLLSVILSYTQLMLDELPPTAPLRVDIEQVHRAGARATDLTRQLLAFSRQQVLQPHYLDLSLVIADMEKILRRVLGADIELSLGLARDLRTVYADRSQVEQILMNLAVNARDAMPHGGRLSIETSGVTVSSSEQAAQLEVEPGGYVMLTVTDTGMGMDAATRERIFEPFFTTKGLGKGTGLGLSTVFGIVKQSGGCVCVDSEPGRGASFRVYLPSSTAEHEELPPAVHVPVTLRGTETVLLVEDDEQVRALTRTLLERHGYVVFDAQNAGEAFLLCEDPATSFDLLLTDIVLPRMSGRELAQRLLRKRPQLRVLFMSGYAEELVTTNDALGRAAFLQKPITPLLLLRKLREVLDAHT